MTPNMYNKDTQQFPNLSGTWKIRTSGVLLSVLVFIGISIWAYMPWWEMALRSDKSPVSWLSSVLLFSCALFSWQLGRYNSLNSRISLWLSISLIALSLDEQFMFHEFWKYHCADWTFLCGAPKTGHIDLLGDAPMMLVAIIGAITFYNLYRTINSTISRNLIIASILTGIFLALGTHFGHEANILPAWFNRFEEPFEVLSEALFLCALMEIQPHQKCIKCNQHPAQI